MTKYIINWDQYEDLWKYLRDHFDRDDFLEIVNEAIASVASCNNDWDWTISQKQEDFMDFIIDNDLLNKSLEEIVILWKLSYEKT